MRYAHSMQSAGMLAPVALGVLVAGLLYGAPARAASGDVKASVDPQAVAEGDQLEYSISASVAGNHKISIEGDPDFGEAFELVGTSNAPSFSMRNGKTHRSLTRTYRLRARQEGEHSIEGPEVHISDSKTTPEPVEVSVSARGDEPDRPDESREADRRDERAFVDHAIEPSDTVYVGQQLILHYYLFADAFRFKINPAPPREPNFDDFWIEDLSRRLSGQRRTLRVDDRVMERANLRSYALFPMRAGKAEIEPLVLEARTGGLLRDREEIELESETVELNVEPLPADAPDSFYEGNVGQWDFQVRVDDKRAEMGEGITVEAAVEGSGHVSRVRVPELPELEGASVRHRDEEVDRSLGKDGVNGSRTHEYTLVADREGTLTIPSLEFSYFDPTSESYETISSEPIDIAIEGGEAPSKSHSAPDQADEDEEDDEREEMLDTLVSRLDPPAEKVALEAAPDPIWRTWTFWLLLLLPALGAVFLWLETPLRRLAARLRPGRHKSVAYREAIELLERAGQAPAAEGLELMQRALTTYMSQVAGVRPGSITEGELPSHLEERGVDATLIARFEALLAGLSEVRYSPDLSAKSARIAELRDECRTCLEELEERRRRETWRPSAAALVLVTGLAAALAATSPAPAEAAEDIDAVVDRAVKAQQQEEWSRAVDAWKEVARAHPYSPEVLYNLGTAFALEGDYGAARLLLERARLLAPLDARYQHNREIVEEIIQLDQVQRARSTAGAQTRQGGLFWWRVASTIPADSAAVALLGCVWLLFIATAVRRFGRRSVVRRIARSAIWIGGAAAVFVLGAWLLRAQLVERIEPGVIVAEQISLREGPTTHAGLADADAALPSGTMVPIAEQRDGWVKLELSGGDLVWAPRDEVIPLQDW